MLLLSNTHWQVFTMQRLFLLVSVLASALYLTGCGTAGAQGPVTEALVAQAKATVSQVTIRGAIPQTTGTPVVYVDGVPATISGTSWSSPVNLQNGTSKVVWVRFEAGGVLVATKSISVSSN